MDESLLSLHGLPFETATKKTPLTVGKAKNTMKKETKEPKAPKVYAKTRGEHFKDIVIAVLVTLIIAFIGGNWYANNVHAATAEAVKSAATSTASVDTPAKK